MSQFRRRATARKGDANAPASEPRHQSGGVRAFAASGSGSDADGFGHARSHPSSSRASSSARSRQAQTVPSVADTERPRASAAARPERFLGVSSHSSYGVERGQEETRSSLDARAGAARSRRPARRPADDGARPEASLGSGPRRPRLRPRRAEPALVCDLKYIQTGQGFLFLAAVQDVYSRRIIGWSMCDDLKAELVLDALGMAVSARGSDSAGVVAHSDHGAQPRFKRSLQHRLVGQSVEARRGPRLASSSRGSFVAGC